MNSVLLSFIFNHIASIQDLISLIDLSMVAIVLSSGWWSSHLGLKVFLMLWSSAYPLVVRSFVISSNVESYEMNKNVP